MCKHFARLFIIFIFCNFLLANELDLANIPDGYAPVVDVPTRGFVTGSHEQQTNDDPQNTTLADTPGGDNDFIRGLLSNGEALKLTADPNENIDLYSGSLNLFYKDVSVQVVPGLNMEYIRSYSSEIYDALPFKDKPKYDYNMTETGWNFHSGYISVLHHCKEKYPSNLCQPVYVQANGHKQSLLQDKNNPNGFETTRHFKGYVGDGHFIFVAPNGFKYYFTHAYVLDRSIRYYLTKVETPDGKHFVQYHYSDILLTRITSSDQSKVINVSFTKETRKIGDVKRTVVQPASVSLNGEQIVSYTYAFNFEFGKYTLLPYTVKYADGRTWTYSYEYINLAPDLHRHGFTTSRYVLSQINHPNGEITAYQYGKDTDRNYKKVLHGSRVIKRTHTGSGKIADGTWDINYSLGPNLDNNATKLVRVNGPYNTIDYLFNYYVNNTVWKGGLLAELKIYTDKSMTSVLQHERYHWDAVLHNYQPYRMSVDKKHGVDMLTYRPILTNKKITRGTDVYTTTYSDYDEYDNPRTIKQNNGKTSRKITQEFLNLSDKNILGLRTKFKVNDQEIISNNYDEHGQVLTATKHGITNHYTYANGLLASLTDANGHTIKYDNYKGGVPELTIHADGKAESQIVNDNGTIASSTNRRGLSTHYNYNNLGQLITTAPAIGDAIYNSYGIGSKTTRHGNTSGTEYYNAYGQVISKVENDKHQMITKYDALGRKIFQSYRLPINENSDQGHYYTYDSLGRMISDCAPSINDDCTTYNYMSNNQKETKFPNGEYKIEKYLAYGDPDNGKISEIIQENRITRIQRDALDYVTSVAQGNLVKKYKYDKNYNLISYAEPETGETTFKYDSVGNVTEKQQHGKYTKYQYNKFDQVTDIFYSDDSYPVTYSYDLNGNLLKAQKNKVINEYQYDDVDHLIYEKLKTEDKSWELKYNYNSLGHLRAIIYPDKSIIEFNPNEEGLPRQVGNYINNINYHSNGKWAGFTFNNNKVAQSHLDEHQRPKHLQYASVHLNYTYDGNNNLAKLELIDKESKDFDYNYDFSYDQIGRLAYAQGNWGQVAYGYDANDNIVSIKSLVNSNIKNIISSNQQLQFNYSKGRLDNVVDKNQALRGMVNSFSYDSFGNITKDKNTKYIYGLDGNLLTSSGQDHATYEYDASGNRAVSKINNKKIVSFYNQAGQLMYEYNAKENTLSKFVHFNNQKIAKVTKQSNSESVNYFYNDIVGSPVAMADDKGKILWYEAYLPYGEKLITTNTKTTPNKHWFVGKETDSSGLGYFGARYYNAGIGRFMSPDPEPVNPENPASFNRYAYGNDNPYKYVDSDGRLSIPVPWVAAAEFVVGFASGATAIYDGTNPGTSLLVGGLIGGFTAVLASPAASRATTLAAAQGFGLTSQAAVTAVTELSVNIAGNAISSKYSSGSYNLSNAAQSGLSSAFADSKVNPMRTTSRGFSDAFFVKKTSALLSFATDKAISAVATYYSNNGNATTVSRPGALIDLNSNTMRSYNSQYDKRYSCNSLIFF